MVTSTGIVVIMVDCCGGGGGAVLATDATIFVSFGFITFVVFCCGVVVVVDSGFVIRV